MSMLSILFMDVALSGCGNACNTRQGTMGRDEKCPGSERKMETMHDRNHLAAGEWQKGIERVFCCFRSNNGRRHDGQQKMMKLKSAVEISEEWLPGSMRRIVQATKW